ncbi:MAG: lysophospholipid acyltransferase family protein [bacterium]|nr:lysophospholipid acyltransferase family protein [bacterium]
MKDNSAWLYRFLRVPFTLIFRFLYHPTIVGKENIPSSGNFIFAGNHTYQLDPIILGSACNKTIHFLAKKELHDSVFAPFFRAVGTIPVDRKIRDKNATNLAEEALKEGKIIGLFPEGTINKTKDIVMPFKYGAVSFAKKTNTLIVPFAITGKYRLFRKGVKLRIGQAIDVSKLSLESANRLLMDKVKELILKK